MTSVTLHDNYNEVKEHDFYHCKSLESIVLPSTVTKIGGDAFCGCRSLTSINLENVKEYGEWCFVGSGFRRWDHAEYPWHCWN